MTRGWAFCAEHGLCSPDFLYSKGRHCFKPHRI